MQKDADYSAILDAYNELASAYVAFEGEQDELAQRARSLHHAVDAALSDSTFVERLREHLRLATAQDTRTTEQLLRSFSAIPHRSKP